MTNTRDAPLTFGQLSVWRGFEVLPAPHRAEANVPRTWPVPPDTTPTQVAAAWNTLVTRHESLRTLFVPDGSNAPLQRVCPADPDWTPTPVTLPRSGPAGPGALETALTTAAAELAREPMDLASDYGWRVGLTDPTAEGERHVVVVIHHVVADSWSFDQLHAEFLAALAGEPPAGPGLSPSALAAEQRSDAAAARRRAAVDHVSRSLVALRSATPPAVAADSGRRVEAELVSPAAHRALVAIADRTGLFPQTVLLAMTASCLHRVWGRCEAKLMLVDGNRTDRRWRPLVTSMSQHVPVPIGGAAEDLTFTELARAMQGASLRAFRHGVYDVDAVAAGVSRAGIDLFDMPSVFNYMAHDLASVPVDGVSRELRPRESPRHTGPRFDLKVYGTPALKLNLRIDPALLAGEGLDALLEWYEKELVRIAANSDEPIREMMCRI